MNYNKIEIYLFSTRSSRKVLQIDQLNIWVSDYMVLQKHYVYERLNRKTMYIRIKVKGYMYV